MGFQFLLYLQFLRLIFSENVYNIRDHPMRYVRKNDKNLELLREKMDRLLSEIPDTVPNNITCNKIKICDSHGVCALVCEEGSVQIDPWVTKTLKFQQNLRENASLCDIQIPGTHNSAITLANGYGIEDHIFEAVLRYIPFFGQFYGVHTNDQLFSLTDQLRMGVRFLELDIHWVDGDIRIAHCGGFKSHLLDSLVYTVNKLTELLHLNIHWDSETIGCIPSLSSIPANDQRHVAESLKEISKWLHSPENDKEFVFIFFDDESDLDQWNKVQFLVKYIEQYFNTSEIFLPRNRTWDQHTRHWPSISELISQGKRIMFLSGVDYGKDADGLLFVKKNVCNWTEPSMINFLPFPICRFKKIIRKITRLWRPISNEIQYGYINGDGHLGPNVWVLNEETIPPLVECSINIPSPDNITPERMKSYIWTWAEGHPFSNYSCAGIPKSHNRWYSMDCTHDNYVYACRQVNIDQWFLQKQRCRSPFYFTFPISPLQNQELLYALEQQNASGVYIHWNAH